jgi:uncharacterized membrane protein
VSFVGVGSDASNWNDVAIAEIGCPAAVEKDVDFEMAVDLQAETGAGQGFAGRLTAVKTRLEGDAATGWQKIDERMVDLSHKRARVNFKTSCAAEGIRRYRVSVESVQGELSALNNVRVFPVDIRKKAIHVLYFTRELGMDYKMLRSEIGRDPGIAFTSLYRTFGERFTVQGERMPGDEDLDAGFPASEKTLELYDCIIIGSFPASEWNAAQMKALVAYVENGGSVVFLGGEFSFGRGGYADTPLAPLFPWQIASVEPDMSRGSFPANVAAAASSHPIVAGVDSLLAEEGESSLESVNSPGPLRLAATALLEARMGNKSMPVMALQPFGKGKVLGIGSNSLWKWARKSKALGAAYGRLMRQTIRNLTGEAEGGRILAVTWDRDHYRPGEEARAEIRVAGERNGEALQLSASVTSDGETTALNVEPQQGVGGNVVRFSFKNRGEYVFKLAAYQKNAPIESYEKTLRVAPLLDEGTKLDLDEAFLGRLAERMGGSYIRAGEVERLAAQLKTGLLDRRSFLETSVVHSGPWYFLAILLLFVVEWILRRRFHLV